MKLLAQVLAILFVFSACSRKVTVTTTPDIPDKDAKVEYPTFKERDHLRGGLTHYRTNYDVTFYELDLDIDIDQQFLSGSVDMHFDVLKTVDTFQIDLFENMKIDAIQYNNNDLEYYRKHDAVFVVMPISLEKGNKAVVTIHYSGNPTVAELPPWDGGFVWEKDEAGNPWVGVACEGDGASLWWPLKDHIYDEPDSMRMNFTVPAGLTCISNGLLLNHTKTAEKETYSWQTNYTINSYNATLYIGKYEHFSMVYENDIYSFPLDYYVLPHNLEKAKKRFHETVEVIKFYEKVFGPYPWKNETFKLVESPYAGMEHQSAIAYGSDYGEGLMNRIYGYDYILVHEAAHEWWGNSLTAPDFAEIWLHEGFATYSEALYREETVGYEEGYIAILDMYGSLIKNERPLIGPYGVSFFDYNDSDVYMKGAQTLHTLRMLINDDAIFFKLMKDFYQQNAYSIATTDDFIALAEQYSGLDLDWFFKQYLHTAPAPVFEYYVAMDYDSNKKVLKYKWTNTDDDFKMPIVIKSLGKEQVIYPSAEMQTIDLESFNVEVNIKKAYCLERVNKEIE